jgi:hypothetical protein
MFIAWPESRGEALMRINRVKRWAWGRSTQVPLLDRLKDSGDSCDALPKNEFRISGVLCGHLDIRLMQINAPGSGMAVDSSAV